MDLGEVETFVRVVEADSMAGAARLLGVPRSTVSRRISRLEEELGLELFVRTTRTLALTAQGEDYYQRVAPAIAQVTEAADLARDAAGEPEGLVRMTMPVDISGLLAGFITEFAEAYPKIQVEIDVSNRTVDLVTEGFDLALRAGNLPDSTLRSVRIGSAPLRFYAAPAYVDRRGLPTSPSELAEHSCVLFRPHAGVVKVELAHDDGTKEPVELRGQIGTTEFGFLREAVRAGAGIGLMPRALNEAEGLVAVLPEWGVPGGAVHLVTPPGRYLPARVRLLRDFFAERLRAVFST